MRLLVLALSCAIVFSSNLKAQEIHVTWNGTSTSLDSNPTELSSTQSFGTIVTQVNDYLYDYSVTLQGTAQSNPGIQDLINIIIAGNADAKRSFVSNCAAYKGRVDALVAALASKNLTPVAPANGKIPSIALGVSQGEYKTAILPKLADLGQPPNKTDPDCLAGIAALANVQQKLAKMASADAGDHTVKGTATLSPGYDYKLTINETYSGAPTDASPRQFTFSPTNNSVTLSAGVAMTWLQSRSYTSTVVPDPATSTTATKTVLAVGDTGAPRPVILALLNYTIFVTKKERLGNLNMAISAGPILQAGGKSDLATLGFFSGLSFSFLHNLYITPGVHVGQYAGPPAGLTNGATIPSGLGNITPLKSWQPSFALGITFRTTSIGAKKVAAQDTSNTAQPQAQNPPKKKP
jgi:hypothetical protein